MNVSSIFNCSACRVLRSLLAPIPVALPMPLVRAQIGGPGEPTSRGVAEGGQGQRDWQSAQRHQALFIQRDRSSCHTEDALSPDSQRCPSLPGGVITRGCPIVSTERRHGKSARSEPSVQHLRARSRFAQRPKRRLVAHVELRRTRHCASEPC